MDKKIIGKILDQSTKVLKEIKNILSMKENILCTQNIEIVECFKILNILVKKKVKLLKYIFTLDHS